MADVIMPDGNVAKIPDFALESTAQLMLKQLTSLTTSNTKGLKELLDHAKDQAKETEKFRKDDESDREDLYKATLDIAKAVRENAKGAAAGTNEPITIGPDVSPTLSRLSEGAITSSQNLSNVGKSAEAAGEGVDGLGDTANDAQAQLDRFNKGAARGEKAFVMFYDGAMGAAQALVGAAVVYGGLLLDSFTGLGAELNKMTKSGVAFGDGVSQGGMSATQAMMQLSGMGLDAAGTMMQFSSVVQSMGKNAFVNMTDSFLEATNAGVDLGMALEDSVERMGAELQKRQLMGAIDGVNQQRLQKQITTSIKNQQKYATALGTSTDELVAFTDSLLQQTPALTANLFRLNADLRSQVIGGITDFGTAMRAMGGEEGGQIAAAMTEAAAAGAMGFSDSMTGYVTALPSLAGPMNKYISAIQAGTLSQEQADEMAQDIAKQLGNVSAAEKNRIFALARAGDAQAESMAKAITQFEQSEKKLKDINKGYTMEGVQKGTNTLTAIMKGLTGSFEAIKTSFLVGLGGVGDQSNRLSDAFNNAKDIIMESVGKAMAKLGLGGGAFENALKGGESLGKALGEKLPDIIAGAAEFIGSAIEAIPGIISGVKSFVSGFMAVMKVVGIVMTPVIWTFKALAATTEFVVGVLDGIVTALVAPFKLIAYAAGLVGDALGYIGGLVYSALSPAIEAIGGMFSKLGEFISPVTDLFSKLGSAISNFFGGFVSEGGSVLGTLGKIAGVALVAVAALGKLGAVTDIMKNFGSTLMNGVGKVGGILEKGLSKATGGLSDKLKDKITERFRGKAKEADMGGKAMESAAKKSQSFTKTLANGMKDISKGISDVFTNLSKGVSNALSNISGGIQKAVTNLSKGLSNVISSIADGLSKAIKSLSSAIGAAGQGIGKGIGGLLQGTLTGLGKGLEALGNPKALLGSTALLIISGAMFVASKAFEVFGDLSWESIGKGFVTLVGLGVVASALGLALPFIIPGAIAIGALGAALIPFAIAANIAAPAITSLFEGLSSIKDVPISSMLALGPALAGMAVGMAALSAGGLISGVLDGLGSLFGAESPFDKIAKIGDAAPHIVSMTDSMNNMGTTVDAFNKAIAQLDGEAAAGEFTAMAKGIDALSASLDNLNMMDLVKMAAMKSFGPIQQEPEAEPEPGTKAESVKHYPGMTDEEFADIGMEWQGPNKGAVPKSTASGFFHDPEDPYAAPTYFEGDKKYPPSSKNTVAGTAKPKPTAGSAKVAPSIGAPKNPTAASAVDTEAANKPTYTYTNDGEGNETMTKTMTLDQLNAHFERLAKNQEQTNRLLSKGNRTQADIADNF